MKLERKGKPGKEALNLEMDCSQSKIDIMGMTGGFLVVL